MKRIFTSVLITSIVSLAALSCIDKKKKSDSNNHKNEIKPILNQYYNDYDPGEEWKLSWSDEFEKDVIDPNNWNFQVEEAGRFNDEWQSYTNSSDNAFIDNNCMVIKAIHKSDVHGMNQYTSARLHTANKYSWKYGKIAARIKLPQGKGMWPAFWMLGANINENGGDTPWPQSGEIDILEFYGSKDDAVIEANIHYANELNSHKMMGAVPFKLEQGKFADSFHIFELEWNKNRITWFVDGQQFASTSITAKELSEFHKEFFILINLAVGGEYAGRPDSSTNFPKFMYIDWVRVYKK